MEIGPLLSAETSAPALSRGLAVLLALEEGEPRALEDLTRALALPKASVFRLLETLQEIGLVQKTADKRYEALCALRPLRDQREVFRRRMSGKLPGLCAALSVTIEWYEPSAEGMVLIDQSIPEAEVRVQARPGFVRQWGGEFDAVARLGYAFDPAAPPPVGLRGHVRDGVLEALSAGMARRMRETARKEGTARDDFLNSNGVRRQALAVFDGAVFRGVLAAAEAARFPRAARGPDLFPALQSILPL